MKSKFVVNSEYTLVKCLGEGLSSTVYEAIRSNLSGISDERVAVKVLKSENSVSWLQNEFESLKRVNSKNCVRVLGYEAFEEGPALVLELVDGVTLYELGRKFILSQNEISEIASQVSNGLREIAQAGFAHGDLNPKNILINREGVVKLIDFGSFRSLTSEIIGSIPYLAFGIWENNKPSLQTDPESLDLIIQDLKLQFTELPTCENSAKSRASEIDGYKYDFTESNPTISQKIGVKVDQLLLQRENLVQTAVIASKPKKSKFKRSWIAAIALFVIVPAQNLLSEPLQQAEPATLLVRTSAWTQIYINGEAEGYSPVSLYGLKPGLYKIRYKRDNGGGELAVFLNPGQKRLLSDAAFD